mmetsp:Transcript_44175/g.122317  ORF Transcript_44175/g.122317 Transcript_44175/m.122317 type:complete len:275 (+) Transcript_44175:33-857(+)
MHARCAPLVPLVVAHALTASNARSNNSFFKPLHERPLKARKDLSCDTVSFAALPSSNMSCTSAATSSSPSSSPPRSPSPFSADVLAAFEDGDGAESPNASSADRLWPTSSSSSVSPLLSPPSSESAEPGTPNVSFLTSFFSHLLSVSSSFVSSFFSHHLSPPASFSSFFSHQLSPLSFFSHHLSPSSFFSSFFSHQLSAPSSFFSSFFSHHLSPESAPSFEAHLSSDFQSLAPPLALPLPLTNSRSSSGGTTPPASIMPKIVEAFVSSPQVKKV